ncbi:hypothetical protein ZOSMA_186G00260 [Zostera marina]|uniref:Uncharacterized protein n=1 Tax=Zostera marina TaxID=29655 RepID=A0A0K9PQD8_ZOSMR|nr:hypothetical protein ZOSMA_186G00260 [Zostera marina]
MDSTPLSIRTDPIRTVRVASAIAPNYNLLGNNPKSKVVAEDNKRHANFTLGQAKRAAFHFLKETEKCNAAMETCEARREEAEMSLRQVRKETAMWELRARKFGWSA